MGLAGLPVLVLLWYSAFLTLASIGIGLTNRRPVRFLRYAGAGGLALAALAFAGLVVLTIARVASGDVPNRLSSGSWAFVAVQFFAGLVSLRLWLQRRYWKSWGAAVVFLMVPPGIFLWYVLLPFPLLLGLGLAGLVLAERDEANEAESVDLSA